MGCMHSCLQISPVHKWRRVDDDLRILSARFLQYVMCLPLAMVLSMSHTGCDERGACLEMHIKLVLAMSVTTIIIAYRLRYSLCKTINS